MSDPITLGIIAANMLAMGAETVLKTSITEAVKDAYKGLKILLARHAPQEVAALEAAPASKGKQLAVAEVIDEKGGADESEIRRLVALLAEAIEKAAQAQPIGIDIGRLEATRVQLGQIEVTNGIGLRAQEIKTEGDFVVNVIKVGQKP